MDKLDETPATVVPLNPEDIITLPSQSNDDLRREQYILRSDPLFFKWQRGQATEQDWLDEVAAIKAEYPDPAE